MTALAGMKAFVMFAFWFFFAGVYFAVDGSGSRVQVGDSEAVSEVAGADGAAVSTEAAPSVVVAGGYVGGIVTGGAADVDSRKWRRTRWEPHWSELYGAGFAPLQRALTIRRR